MVHFIFQINQGAFNEIGGLHHSTILQKSLVDHFVPFLPLEKQHVKMCILAEAANRSLTEKDIENVMSHMTFWPKGVGVFSTTGCKKVAQKVDLVLEEMYDDL